MEQEDFKLLFEAVDVAIRHPSLSAPSLYAQVIVLQCAVPNVKERGQYDNIPVALLFPSVRNP